jgi:CDP-6-deoxy-D-xylo-4-hexulose-3-dehydrase
MNEAVLRFVQQMRGDRAPAAFVPGQTVIPPSGKLVDEPEIALMIEAALDGWLTTGRFNEIFERRLAEFIGVNHLATVNSGSSANLVAFSTLTSPKLGERAIKKGDEVITAATGFPTTVNPTMQFGAVPVFVDTDPKTYNIDASLVEAAITPKTKAIMIAHTLGNPFDLSVIKPLCEKYGLWLIEDCCDALGTSYDGRIVGTFGHIGTLSFYPAHHITTGEGGAVFTSDPELKAITESFRDWGRDCYCAPGKDNTCGKRFCWQLGGLPEGYDHKYIYSHSGYNLKMTDMQAACGVAQLDRLPGFIAKRRANMAYLKQRLAGCAKFIQLPEATPNSDPSWFGFAMTMREGTGFRRRDLVEYLNDNRVGTRLLFGGNLIKQPYMANQRFRVHGELPVAERIMNDTFWIGIYPGLGETELDFVGETIESFFGLNF